jgi:DMSO/TMAO reductase YedYZ molybdopterin-dependent catalytic subunit
MDTSEKKPIETPRDAERKVIVPQPDPAIAGPTEIVSDQEAKKRSRRAFLVGGAAAVVGYGGFRWLTAQPKDDGILWPFRKVLQANEKIATGYFSNGNLAPTFDVNQAARNPRLNGDIGLDSPIDLNAWRLTVAGLDERAVPGGTALLTLDDLRRLPHVEMVTELKCIEGWSEIIYWGGVRFSDFMRAYPPAANGASLPRFVGIETPDKGYFVGMDIESMMHPQTLLCYEINGRPLSAEHGAPLRIATASKYGVKNIKRIGTIRYTNVRPADYWAQYGYDWYAGL